MAIIGYTKLFNSIVTSTIWSEPNATRIVWITMLASCDRDGFVPASIPGLANLARVGIEECKKAIETLESPDEYSRSQEFDGRRIEKVDGGWRLLNHSKYRKILSEQERREYNSRKQREYRERKKVSSNVTEREQFVTASTHTDTDTDTDKRKEKTLCAAKGAAPIASGFSFFWQAYPRKLGRAKAEKSWIKQRCEAQTETVLSNLEAWKEIWKEQEFIPYPATWLNDGRWKEKPQDKEKLSGDELERLRARLYS